MLNTTDITNKIAQMKERYSNLFTIQTQEVITDLNQLTEIVEQAQAIQIKAKVEEPKANKETIEPYNKNIDTIIQQEQTETKEENKGTDETKEDVVKRYIEKMNKKPFQGRSIEVMKQKMGE